MSNVKYRQKKKEVWETPNVWDVGKSVIYVQTLNGMSEKQWIKLQIKEAQ